MANAAQTSEESYICYLLLAELFFCPEDGGDMFLRDVDFTFNGLHGVISQNIELILTTAVRTSNPAPGGMSVDVSTVLS
jgi:hypothetical protein